MCHRPGGDAPFSLLTYSAVRQRAKIVAAVTARRQMPPWKAETDAGAFEGLQPLSAKEIDAIRQWADSAMPEGEPGDLPKVPHWSDGWQLGSPDLVVTAPQAYTLQADGADEYRTFVIPVPIERRRNVRGMEFRPGAAGVVHHANILLDQTPRSRELDERDPSPGYDGPLARTAMNPEGHFLGYTPGRPDPLLPKGLAWRLDPGTDLVLQLHLKPTGRPETIRPLAAFYFTDDTPARIPFIMRLGRQALDIAPGEKSYRITDSYVVPVDLQLQSLKPHAHYLAREIRALATFPDGTTKRLLYIRDWDFKWQNVYRFATPVALPRGSTLAMEFTYDNSDSNARNPTRPPRAVTWGPASTDEMGDLWVQVLPRDDGARAILARDFRPKAAAEEIVGYRGLLAREPDNPILNDDIALLYLELGQPDASVAHFERSLRVQPDSAAGRFNLGTALMAAGRNGDAVDQLEEAVRLRPDYAPAHNNLGNALAEQNRLDEAVSHYVAALHLDPNHARAHNGIATVLMERGRLDEAVSHLRAALKIEPGLGEAHHNMGRIEQARGRYAEAVRHFRDAAAAHAAGGAFDKALAIVAEAIKLNPPEAVLRELLADQALYEDRRPVRRGSELL